MKRVIRFALITLICMLSIFWIAIVNNTDFAAKLGLASGPGKPVEVAEKRDYPAAIMVDDVVYYLAYAMPAEIDESAIAGYTTSYTDGMPQNNGETNFSREVNMPYAKVSNGIAILYENEWWLCKP